MTIYRKTFLPSSVFALLEQITEVFRKGECDETLSLTVQSVKLTEINVMTGHVDRRHRCLVVQPAFDDIDLHVHE